MSVCQARTQPLTHLDPLLLPAEEAVAAERLAVAEEEPQVAPLPEDAPRRAEDVFGLGSGVVWW